VSVQPPTASVPLRDRRPPLAQTGSYVVIVEGPICVLVNKRVGDFSAILRVKFDGYDIDPHGR
jgi:hypothetical protein